MVKVNLGGCASFVKDEDYKKYVGKALEAFDVLESESGAGNDFLGWKHLPSQTPESLIADCEAVRDCWKAKGVNLVVVIGIGGSYLGARCAIEALSHNFAKQLGGAKEAPEVVFAGNNLSEEYLAELMDLVAERNVATVVISKSGTTTEPAVAFRIVKEHIEKTYKDASERIVAITDAHKGALKTLSTQEGYKTFVVPDNVGGPVLRPHSGRTSADRAGGIRCARDDRRRCRDGEGSSIEKWETGSPELKKIYEIMTRTDGIYGGRFSGAGFKGCCMALIDPSFKEEIFKKVETEHLAEFPDLRGHYSACICHSADGVKI